MKVEIIDGLIKLTGDGSEADNMAIIAIQELTAEHELMTDDIINDHGCESFDGKWQNYMHLPLIIPEFNED